MQYKSWGHGIPRFLTVYHWSSWIQMRPFCKNVVESHYLFPISASTRLKKANQTIN